MSITIDQHSYTDKLESITLNKEHVLCSQRKISKHDKPSLRGAIGQ